VIAVRSAGGTLLFVDMGLSCLELRKRATACGVDVSSAAGVFFTHDHDDHYCGIATFHKRYPGIPLFANGDTADAIAARTGVADGWNVFETAVAFEFEDFTITPFSISHDAADPVGYLLEAGGRALFIGTDMGYVTENVRAAFARATCAVLEANHDPILLEQSARPVSLKQRIRGRTGHLANEDAAMLLVETNPPGLKALLLGHISQECNSRSLARQAFTDALARIGRSDISLSLLDQDSPCDLFEF
jgi:phosphoribosyl 1,2-cyclic phosphodiesterase